MANVSFKICTKATFNGMAQNARTVGALYFISDTREIYRISDDHEAVRCTDNVEIVTAFPTTGDRLGVLYINSATRETRVWNGSSWITVGLSNFSAVSSSAGSADNGKLPLLGSDGKLSSSFIPEIALNHYIGSKTSMSALKAATAEKGDWAQISSGADAGSYILDSDTNGSSAVWVKMGNPNTYALPAATSSIRGGVTIPASGSGLSISGDVLSVASSIAGTGLSYNNGVLNVNMGTTSTTVAAGNHTHSNYVVKPTNEEVNGYVLASNGSGSTVWTSPTAVTSIEWEDL